MPSPSARLLEPHATFGSVEYRFVGLERRARKTFLRFESTAIAHDLLDSL